MGEAEIDNYFDSHAFSFKSFQVIQIFPTQHLQEKGWAIVGHNLNTDKRPRTSTKSSSGQSNFMKT